MPGNWSTDDLNWRAALLPWTHWRCSRCEVDVKATGRTPKCPRCGRKDKLTETQPPNE